MVNARLAHAHRGKMAMTTEANTKIEPTAEQVDTLAKYTTGRKLVVRAYAGCGKTTMLKMIARSNPRRAGVYLAFNKSIATEAAREFPSNVTCSTVHSLAYRAMARRFSREKMGGKLSGGFVAARLNLQSLTVRDSEIGQVVLSLSARGLGTLIVAAVTTWQRSGRRELSLLDVVAEGKLAMIDAKIVGNLRAVVLQHARKLWQQMIDPRSTMPLGHDGYLKLWALERPIIAGDFIMLDEAQDTNGVVLELVKHQRAQIITVGDAHQQIYEWRGAQDAMRLLPAEVEGRLTTSWRFGPRIAGYASHVLSLLGETIPLQGNPARDDRIDVIEGKPDAILARTNSRLIKEIVEALGKDLRPHVIGGTFELQQILEAIEKLQAGYSVEYPLEFFGFKNWDEVKQAAEGPDGAELERWVRLLKDYDAADLRRMLADLPEDERQGDLILSTGHKAKGREWPRVRLCDDFLRGIGEKNQDGTPKVIDPAAVAAELRLFYVAATRGREQLEVPPTLTAKLATLAPLPAAAPAPVDTRLHAPAETPVEPARAPADDEFEPIVLDPVREDAPAPAVSRPLAGSSADDEFAPVEIIPAAKTAAGAPAPARRKRFSSAEWAAIAETLREALPGLAGDRRATIEKALGKIALAA